MSSRIDKKKEGKKRKRLNWVIWVVALLLVAGGTYALYIYNQVENAVETMNHPLERDSDPEYKEKIQDKLKNKESVNMLLLGVDERSGDGGRSDTMIFVSMNPNTDSMLMFSIPRDTYVEIPGRSGKDKINHAYAFGGTQLAIETAERFLDTTIDFYAKVNMEGFKEGVDALGGVTVNNSLAFSYEGFDFPKGELSLNGEEALAYSRMRKEDPKGDFGRNDRQRQVVTAAAREAASFSTVTKVTNLLSIMGGNVKTNIDMNEITQLFSGYRGSIGNQESLQVEGHSETINKIWYWVVPNDKLNSIRSKIKAHMEV